MILKHPGIWKLLLCSEKHLKDKHLKHSILEHHYGSNEEDRLQRAQIWRQNGHSADSYNISRERIRV